jgi:hypothetical protein
VIQLITILKQLGIALFPKSFQIAMIVLLIESLRALHLVLALMMIPHRNFQQHLAMLPLTIVGVKCRQLSQS